MSWRGNNNEIRSNGIVNKMFWVNTNITKENMVVVEDRIFSNEMRSENPDPYS